MTLPQLLRFLAKSMNTLSAGIHPASDLEGKPFAADSEEHQLIGKPIAGPYSFCWIGLKGDNEFIQVVTRSARWWRCNFVCRRCFASQKLESLLYTDVSDAPGWLETLTHTNHYLEATPDGERRRRAAEQLNLQNRFACKFCAAEAAEDVCISVMHACSFAKFANNTHAS